jgi:serine/threonine protein kinase
MVLELLKGGELLEHIQEIKKYTERKAAQLFVQILRAVAHMHSK